MLISSSSISSHMSSSVSESWPRPALVKHCLANTALPTSVKQTSVWPPGPSLHSRTNQMRAFVILTNQRPDHTCTPGRPRSCGTQPGSSPSGCRAPGEAGAGGVGRIGAWGWAAARGRPRPGPARPRTPGE